MRGFLIGLFLFSGLHALAATEPDTIANWQLYFKQLQLKAFNTNDKDLRVRFTQTQMKYIDTLTIRYWDDTPCFECNGILTLTTLKDETLQTIDRANSNFRYDLSMDELRALALKNKVAVIRFYFREQAKGTTLLLFELEFP